MRKNQKVYTNKMVTIKIIDNQHTEKNIAAEKGENLFSVLGRFGIVFKGNCGGKGVCGACKVWIEEEKRYENACKVILNQDITIRLSYTLDKGAEGVLLTQETSNGNSFTEKGDSYGFAVDIGTTTIGISLMDLQKGITISEYGMLNGQGVYGADVSSRIAYGSSEKGRHDLRQVLLDNLLEGFELLLNRCTIKKEQIKKIVLTGNTTMLHTIQGLDLEGLGRYPFTPVSIMKRTAKAEDIFSNDDYINALVCITPCISAYVGSDVTMGAAYLGMGKKEAFTLLLDLGTNGEMLLINKERGICSSTACGPAFEGFFKTGALYGTSLLEILVHNYDRGLVDETGCIHKRYAATGIPMGGGRFLSQDTIRKLQLAKAAIGAGIAILVKNCGITYEQIETVYIAGGFGFHLDLEKSKKIGLLPEAIIEKCQVVGNTSLKGAKDALINESLIKEAEEIIEKTTNIDLANDKTFQDTYIHMIHFK